VDDERNALDIEERALALSTHELGEARRRMEGVFSEPGPNRATFRRCYARNRSVCWPSSIRASRSSAPRKSLA
jgi:hypothetical protein